MWEANWARYLNFLVWHQAIRSWRYEPHTFEFTAIRRGVRFYTPDFEVIENDGTLFYEEVKGYMDHKSAVQLKRMAKYYPHIKIRLIDRHVYRVIARDVSAWLPQWERERARQT